MKKIIVFDFDKTLTYKDSLKELFLQEMIGGKCFLRIFYLILTLLSKLKVIKVRKEKEIMIGILFDSDEQLFSQRCREYAKKIELTPLFQKVKENVDASKKVIILSASSVFLLEEVFKGIDVELIGTTFCCQDGKIIKIDKHPFSKEKVDLIREKGIVDIDEMYYDSHLDECLIPLCKKWNKVKNGIVIETYYRK